MNRLCLLLFGMMAFVAHAQVPDYVPTEGLVGWYPFSGNADDGSGNEQDGEVIGAQLTTDRFGSTESAYAFEHTRIEIGNSAALDQFKTISFWFISSSSSGNQVAFKQNAYVGPLYERVSCTILLGGTHFAGKELCNSGWQYENVGGELNDSTWHHYVGVLDSTQKRLYIDGMLLDESNFNPGNMCSGGDFIIGQEWNGVPYDFIGNLDDFGFWNRTLTEEEILALYNAPAPAPGCTSPLACNFNEQANEDNGSCTYPPFGLTDCEAGGALCGEGTIWDASLQSCVGFNDCPSDLDGDGIVGVNDLLSLLSDFGADCPPEVAAWTCGDPVNYHGYDYATVQIGEQCWFAENLRTEQYQNGDVIPGDLSSSQWTNTESGAQAVYGDDEGNLDLYGRLYNGYAMADVRALCPTNWHVPSDEDWGVLELELGLDESELLLIGERGDDQGTQLKASTSDTPSWDGTNTSGFSAVANGYRHNHGYYQHINFNSHYWSHTASEEGIFYIRVLQNSVDGIYRLTRVTNSGYTIRCVAD